MEFNSNYYGNGYDGGYGGPRRPRRGMTTGGIIAIVFIAVIVGILAVSAILPKGDSNTPNLPNLPFFPQNTPNEHVADTTPKQTVPTPLPTTRPAVAFDGVAPTITDMYNPIPDIVDAVSPGVVSVVNYKSGVAMGIISTDTIQGTGTGFFISSKGYIITNEHVIDGADKIMITLSDGTELQAELLGSDATLDVAVLKIPGNGYTALKLGDSSKARVGDFVVAIGDPTGLSLAGTPTFGIISAMERSVNIEGKSNTYIQTDAAINPGNSGGPLINMKGEVIGVTSAKTVTASYDEYGNPISAEGLGFALPINGVREIVNLLITNGYVLRPGIGASLIVMTETYYQAYDRPMGMIVYLVLEDGPAFNAGLRADDIIVECNGNAIKEHEDLTSAIKAAGVGGRLSLKYWRNGKYYTTTLTVGDLNSIGDKVYNNEYGGSFFNDEGDVNP